MEKEHRDEEHTVTMRSEAQQAASRANGALSRGPTTAAGKRRSARNSTRHGATAVTVRPPGEPAEFEGSLVAALTEQIQPTVDAERHIVRDLAGDLLRLDRVRRAEEAARELSLIEITKRYEEDNRLILLIQREKPLWESLVRNAKLALQRIGDRDAYKDAAELVDALTLFVRELMDHLDGQIDTSVEPAEALVEEVARLDAGPLPAQLRAAALSRIGALGVEYLDHLYAVTVSTEEARRSAERQLANVPDEKTTRRLARYATAAQNTALKRVELIRSLRELAAHGEPDS